MSKTFVFGQAGGIEYSLYRDEDWEGVKKVLYTAFFMNESVCRGVNLHLPETEQGRDELAALSFDSLRDGVSIVARDVATNEIVGHSINKLQYRPTDPTKPGYFATFKEQHCRNPNARTLIDLMCTVDSLVNMWEHCSTECLFELMFLGTLPSHEGRGIGTRLTEFSLQLARQLSRSETEPVPLVEAVRDEPRLPLAASAIFTSAFSQRIGQRFGFEELAVRRFADFVYEGKTYAERIGDERHQVLSLCVLKF